MIWRPFPAPRSLAGNLSLAPVLPAATPGTSCQHVFSDQILAPPAPDTGAGAGGAASGSWRRVGSAMGLRGRIRRQLLGRQLFLEKHFDLVELLSFSISFSKFETVFIGIMYIAVLAQLLFKAA
jgi:hypothetical protein